MKWIIAACVAVLVSNAVADTATPARTPDLRFKDAPVRAAVLGDLLGKTCDEARAELRTFHFGLEACPIGAATGKVPAGRINAQSLPPGTPASRLAGLHVTLEPQPGPPAPPVPVAVLPDVRGKTCEQARALLQQLNVALVDCRPGQARIRTSVGTINAQSQPPGTPTSRVDGLRVTVEPRPTPEGKPQGTSDGVPERGADVTPGTTQGSGRDNAAAAAAAAAVAAALGAIIANADKRVLPDVRGRTCEQARADLRAVRVELLDCVAGNAGSRFPPGTISAQSPEGGTPLSRVKGVRTRFEPPRRALPDLRDRTCDEAAGLLAALGLEAASCTPGDAVAGYRTGRVNAQSPAAGTLLPLSEPVVLRVQPTPMVIVPRLLDLGETQAAAALASRGLPARPSGPPAGKGRRVLSQDPAAGSAVPPGSSVAYVLGLSVPRLLGLDCAGARARAAEYGHAQLDCEPRPAPSASERVGSVFEQTPVAGGPALPAPVAIRVVAWAAQPVTVPDVREHALDEAIATIEAARLVPRPDVRQGERGERGGERIVAQQSPAPGTVVDAGSAVDLVTREVVDVPDVVGQALDAAQSTLERARLVAAPEAADHAAERIVQAQTPAAGARVAVGSPVQLATRRFATVPDLAGKTCDEARAIVPSPALPFELDCRAEDNWRADVLDAPRVATQQPIAQTRAPAGTRIVTDARAPLPGWVPQPLANLPLAAAAGVVVAPLLALELVLWKLWPPPPPPSLPLPASTPATPAHGVPLVPPPVPPRAPTFNWRVAADASPAVSLRWPEADTTTEEHKMLSRALPKMTWRVVPDAGHVLLREIDPSDGGGHAKR